MTSTTGYPIYTYTGTAIANQKTISAGDTIYFGAASTQNSLPTVSHRTTRNPDSSSML